MASILLLTWSASAQVTLSRHDPWARGISLPMDWGLELGDQGKEQPTWASRQVTPEKTLSPPRQEQASFVT